MSHEGRFSQLCPMCDGGNNDRREWDGDPCFDCNGRGRITRRDLAIGGK